MGNIGMWAAVLGAIVAFACFYRLLRVIYIDGRLDTQAFMTARGAGQLPAFVTVAAMGVQLGIMLLFPSTVTWITWTLGVTAIGGGAWAMERGRIAVRRQRRTQP